MAKRVQRRRGTTTEHSSFTGYDGETTVDTTKDTVVVHDGAQIGGYPLAREDLTNVTLTNLIGVAELKLSDGTANQVIKTDGSGTISFGTIDVSSTAVGGDLSGTVGNALISDNKVGIAELNVSDGTNGQDLLLMDQVFFRLVMFLQILLWVECLVVQHLMHPLIIML